jgi:hypothetical protein
LKITSRPTAQFACPRFWNPISRPDFKRQSGVVYKSGANRATKIGAESQHRGHEWLKETWGGRKICRPPPLFCESKIRRNQFSPTSF